MNSHLRPFRVFLENIRAKTTHPKVEICKGADIEVSDANKLRFLRLFVEHHLEHSISCQARLVRRGLLRVVCAGMLKAERRSGAVDSEERLEAILGSNNPCESNLGSRAEIWFMIRNADLNLRVLLL